MNVTLEPSTLTGTVTAPPSKSMTHRHLIISALANGMSIIESPLKSDDTIATVEALIQMGIAVTEKGDNWMMLGGTLSPPASEINCNESGTTILFSSHYMSDV
ncbi:MAG: 3-phosphoshikimate 1-carboxyvinyltransferase, partial [bacterium]